MVNVSTLELFTKVKECFLQELEINVEEWEINKIHRIGNIQKSGKQRPVLLSFVSGWKKREMMENKKKLKNIYIAEDYSKETLEKRKALQPQLIEERKKGNLAIIKYDKLIVKRNTIKEKRKRQTPTPPETDAQPRKQKTLNTLRLVLVGGKDHNPPTTQDKNSKNKRRKPKVPKLYIAALNVLTLKNEENLVELGLSEVRRTGERIISYPDFLLYYIGTTPGHHGVGFIIKRHLLNYVESFIGISERIALINLKLPGYEDPWSIIQVYSPTEQYDSGSIDSFYLELNKTIQNHTYKNFILMGDFNGQIGVQQLEENTVLGPFVYRKKTRSKNGEKLIYFAQENCLKALNTMFKKKKKKMWTWISPDGKTKNEIDFIMTNKSRYFSNITVISNFNFNTNHRMIRAELMTIPPKNPRPRNNTINRKPNKYQTAQIGNYIISKLTNYEQDTTNMKLQEKYNWLERTIKTSIQQVTCSKDLSNKWMTTNTMNLLNQRADLIKGKNTNDSREQIAKLSKEIKTRIRKDRIQSRMETIERHILQTSGIKKAYKELTNKKDWIIQMKHNNGLKEKRRQGILGIATSYYKELYQSTAEVKGIELLDVSPVPSIMQEEIEFALETQKNDKAPRPDGISNEILKQAMSTISEIIGP
ncbi:uncharacterized protein LOC123657463 [Melitaea cinxia]|uniref:uncharacterized protein LOC123657463 n=1 Tax=Melitaea cinxia TaxID=113334 RepID=UPI001E272A5A|nr:uncharacterized protein LOC123657463 [Melitaea cinxia]